MAKWEYQVESFSLTDRHSSWKQVEELQRLQDGLNALGSEGWELVSYVDVPMHGYGGKQKGSVHLSFWKRPMGSGSSALPTRSGMTDTPG